MKPFALEPNMLTMRGVFYPTGHMFVMFPTEQEARDAVGLLIGDGCSGDAISLLTPGDIQDKIAPTLGDHDPAMPSPGTEAATVHHFVQLALQGHHALLIHAPTGHETEHIMEVLQPAKISYGQKYRQLVIEDLVE